MSEFFKEVIQRLNNNGTNQSLIDASKNFMIKSTKPKYSYNYFALGCPIIQYPQDMIAIQELIWEVKPDLIIETGIAHGGSVIMSASALALLDICEAIKNKQKFDPNKSNRKVIGIDIDIRKHNRSAIENHPMVSRIELLEGSSIDPKIIEKVKSISKNYKKILVCLDSNHTHNHVLLELNAYAPLTSINSYCVVFDTIIEDMPKGTFEDKAWDVGDNPKTAVREYLKNHPEFEIDKNIDNKLMISVAPEGYLKKVS
jgi:cephalosporin hydroxylase|tara:strand:+ start:5629 stop:6399 length:771 start_codon:yes stop_codon:yes gene_type:complete